MAEELKHLIEQIQREGVEKAEEQAAAILSQAKEKAAKIVAEAEAKARESLLKARSESEAFAERSAKTLEQAARDLLITVGQGCEKVVAAVLGREVDAALTGELLHRMIAGVINQGGDHATVSVSTRDKVDLATYCAALARETGKEIELHSDSEILSGFRIGFKDRNVYLDYTGEAIAAALAAFLRPELAQTVSAVAREQMG